MPYLLLSLRRILLLLIVGAGSMLQAQTLKQAGITLSASAWNDIRIGDDSGKTLITLTGFRAKPAPAVSARTGSVNEITTGEGMPALEVRYELAGDSGPSPVRLLARFIPRPNRVDVHYELTGAPDDARLDACMFGRRLADDARPLPAAKLGLWRRHPSGGQPVEIPDGRLASWDIGDRVVSLAFDASNDANLGWKDARLQHTGMRKAASGAFTADFAILITPAGWPPEIIAASWHDRPLGLHIGTGRTYNWWTENTAPLELRNLLVNTSGETRAVTLRRWVRDFSGKLRVDDTRDITLKPGQSFDDPARFKTEDERGIYFAEVSATDRKTGAEVFARTNLTLLPPHVFKSTAADSLFGLASYWPLPTETDAQRVMARMGVRWLRNGDTRNYKDISANHHCQVPWKITDPAKRDAWIRDQLQTCVDRGDYAWEFGNEINYAVMSIGMGDVLKDQARARRVAGYVQWLRDIRRVQKAMGPPATRVKLLSVGLAGMDVKFLQEIRDAGGWDLLDGLAIHPGRGNFTADYPVSEPWQNWTHGAYGNYWNYYGSVRTARELLQNYGGGKTLWLTEAYTCGFPNSFWEDSLRHGAENVVLSFALAKSEDVKAVMWYQLLDTVWYDKLGVNPGNREYYFGLIQRDLSFKPALLAYCAVAEALDQATFVRWLRFPGRAKTRGLLFSTPRGPMAVLWDRTDGYVLTKKTPDFASPEPWTDTWRTRAPLALPVEGAGLTAINAIGQGAFLPAKDATATVTLTGAPVIVYGLDAARLP